MKNFKYAKKVMGLLMLCCIMISMMSCSKKSSIPSPEEPLGLAEMGVDTLFFGSNMSQTLEVFGSPVKQALETEGQASGAELKLLEYAGLRLVYYDVEDEFLLCAATVTSSKYAGPRGLRVGDSKEKVINAFPQTRNFKSVQADVEVLFGASEYKGDIIPPKGEIYTSADQPDRETIIYMSPAGKYGDPFDKVPFAYYEHAVLTYEIVNNKVAAIILFQGTLA